ncbi:serine O-acetyltransferase EpsC [Anaerococcus sp.]|uniref:serine O-acetyltransferase EpsC n=1 Tax=Anaerococcus sp. TaxID=1872515 RepID=UPI00258B3AAD|nr:serine O-acetyltransferase EpsC [Anaerococcus sp.]MDU3211492.1 serine O-acetyltransferase EpsC [Anaerococcus sp.]
MISYDKYKKELLESALKKDPALRSEEEAILYSPGVKALLSHYRAHELWVNGNLYEANELAFKSRMETGIEIHPGASIGRRCYIDHGMGVVIGETAEVGDDCLIYHGVTLGAVENKIGKRHPTVGNDVMLGAGSVILGDIHIGDHVKIGANAVVLEDVESHSTAVGAPARVLKR